MFVVNVPKVPGVPAVNFSSLVSTVTSFLTADAINVFRGANRTQQWGIYLGGTPVVLADNVVSFDYRHQWTVADYPIERGSFESYDKVRAPYDARFRFTAGGSESNRESFLNSIAAIAGTLQLFNIVTPEAVYSSATITHYDYTRTANNGLGLMIVDVWTQEIIQNTGAGYYSAAAPQSAQVIPGGTSQATPATANNYSAIGNPAERGVIGLK